MNFGEILIYLNPLLILFAIYFGYQNLSRSQKKNDKKYDSLLYVILGNHTFLLLLLSYYFLTTNLRFEYVSDYSANDLSIWYKLAGLWAGRDGTLLIWSWATILTLVLERFFDKKSSKQRELTSLFGMILLLSLAIIQLYINPFSLNENTPDDGKGLNPLLLSPYMIIHPPIVFISYGMIVLLYASGISFLITEDKRWNDTIKRWGRGSWIGMSLALIIGGFWAYVTLGWGGYWAWDPVETAGLLPWFSMTTLLHTSIMSRRKKTYSVLGPLLAMLTFVLVLLESFVTRGGIWSSVHSFIVEDTGGTWSRLSYVLENDLSVRGFFIMMILTLIITLIIVLKKYKEKEDNEKNEKYDTLEDFFSEDNTFFAAIYTQLLILTVTLVLLLVRANGYLAPEVFDVRLAPFVIILAGIFTIHTLRPFMDLQKILAIVTICGIFSIIYAFLSEGKAWMVGAMIPWALVCGYSIIKYLHKYRTKKLLPMLKAWGPYTAHLGIMLIIIGYCFSYGLGSENSVTLDEGERKLAGNFILELTDISMNNDGTEVEVKADIMLADRETGETVVNDKISKTVQSVTNQETTQIYLKHEIHRDIYITLNSVTPGTDENQTSATITVREIPGIFLVWIGAFLTILGMLTTMFTDWKPGKNWLVRLSS